MPIKTADQFKVEQCIWQKINSFPVLRLFAPNNCRALKKYMTKRLYFVQCRGTGLQIQLRIPGRVTTKRWMEQLNAPHIDLLISMGPHVRALSHANAYATTMRIWYVNFSTLGVSWKRKCSVISGYNCNNRAKQFAQKNFRLAKWAINESVKFQSNKKLI